MTLSVFLSWLEVGSDVRFMHTSLHIVTVSSNHKKDRNIPYYGPSLDALQSLIDFLRLPWVHAPAAFFESTATILHLCWHRSSLNFGLQAPA
jgi:hypothetical protein